MLSRKITAIVLTVCFSFTPCYAINSTDFLRNNSVGEGVLEYADKEIYFFERNPYRIKFSQDYTGIYLWDNNHHLYCVKNGQPVTFTMDYLRSWQKEINRKEQLEQAVSDFLYAYENHIGYNAPFWNTNDIRELFVFEMLISDSLSTSLMFVGQDNLISFEYNDSNPDIFTIKMNTKEQVEKFRQEVSITNQILQECDTLVNATSDPFEKIRRINHLITEKLTYNGQKKCSGTGYTEIDALCYGTGTVCAGYTNLFKLLCDRYGIETEIIEEDPNQENYHSWNANCINGNWYYTDTTWNDGLNDCFLLLTKEEFDARRTEMMMTTETTIATSES